MLVKSTSSLRKSLDILGQRLGIECSGDWYKVTPKDLTNAGGDHILSQFKGSISTSLQSIYPEFDWYPWMFKNSSASFWKDVNNQKVYLDWLGIQIGIKTPYEWLKITNDEIFAFPGGKHFLSMYKNSMLRALGSVYKDINWQVWKKKQYYDYRASFDRLASSLNIQTSEDWYSVHSLDHKFKNDVLTRFDGSLLNALRCVYPEFDWVPWFFEKTPNHVWTDASNHRKLFDWIAVQLGITQASDWYSIVTEDVLYFGAGRVLALYGGSLVSCLVKLYPEHNFRPWMFERTPRHYWGNKDNQKAYMEWLGNRLNVSHTLQWMNVSLRDFVANSGSGLLGYHKGRLSLLLQHVYPQVFPCLNLFSVSSGHFEALSVLKQFIKEDVVINYRLTHNSSTYELDMYFPSLAVAFEFQGAQHYKDIEGITTVGAQKKRRQRDAEKVNVCKELGISLYEIPYWWDSNISSFQSKVAQLTST